MILGFPTGVTDAPSYAIATFERSIYLSKDSGRTWTPIAVHGKGK